MNMLAVAPTLLDSLEDELTLDALLAEAWSGLGAHQVVECPVCRGEMRPDYGAQTRPVGGRCADCTATLR